MFSSWSQVTFGEVFDFHHSFELCFFFSFISVSFSRRKRQKRTKERERVATFSPEKRCQKRVCAFTVDYLDVCQRLSSATCKNYFPFGTLFVTEAHTRSPGCLMYALKSLAWCFVDALKSFARCFGARFCASLDKSALRVRSKFESRFWGAIKSYNSGVLKNSKTDDKFPKFPLRVRWKRY